MRLIDLTGQRFGRLVVLKRGEDYVTETLKPYGDPVRHVRVRWICRCDCGKETLVQASALRAGTTTSCGCWRREYLSERNRKKT